MSDTAVAEWWARWGRAQQITVDRRPDTLRGRVRRWLFRHVVGYECELCHICGSRYSGFSWWAESELWNRATRGRYGVLCPRCFTRLGDQQGEMVCWFALPREVWDEVVGTDVRAAIATWQAERAGNDA